MSEYRNIIRFRKTSLLALALAACACSPAAAQDQRSQEGGTWAGTISISYTWDEEGARGVITSTANLRLRETREQPITDLTGRVIGSKTTLVHTASSISENYAGVAGTAGGNPGVACEGSGPAELSGEAGTIWRNSSGADATGVVGFSFPAEGTYSIDLNTAVGSQHYPVRCANGGTHESAFTAPPIGMDVPEDPGRKIEDRGARMRGSYRGNWNAGQIQVTWDLRGGDCFSPDRGFVFYTGPGGARSDPSIDSPMVGRPPVGVRLMFTGKTRGLSGETWFQVALPGAATWPQVEQPATVWVPASAVSCVRPTVPPPPRPTGPPKDTPPLATVNPPRYDPDIECNEGEYAKDYGVFLGWFMFTFTRPGRDHKCYDPGVDQSDSPRVPGGRS